MAARNLQPVRALHPEVVIMPGKFTGNGAANPTASTRKGRGWSVTYLSSTGKYRITLTDKFHDLVAFVANVEDLTAPDDWEVTIDSETVASTRQINVSTWKGGALADLTSDEKLHFIACLLNTAQLPIRG